MVLGYIVFTVCAIGFISYANAEIDEKYQDVPPECQEFIHTEETTLGNKTTTLLNCKWLIEEITPPSINVKQPDLTPEEEKVIDDAKKCREDPECERPPVIEPEKVYDDLTEEEEKLEKARDKIDNYCADFKDSPVEIIACDSYKTIKLCEQGINESYPVQKHRFFLTTDFELSVWYFLNYRVGVDYVVGVLQKAKLECEYQRDILEPIILGPQYQDIADANVNYTQPYHGDVALSGNIILPLRLTPAVFANSLQVAEDTRCSLRQFQSSWVDYGCTKPPVQDCYMPTDEQLMNIYNKIWQEEFRDTPIKEIYQEKYDTCLSKVASMELKEPTWYMDYLNSLQPMRNYNNYFKNPISAVPIGIPDIGVEITGCSGSEGECKLVFPAN